MCSEDPSMNTPPEEGPVLPREEAPQEELPREEPALGKPSPYDHSPFESPFAAPSAPAPKKPRRSPKSLLSLALCAGVLLGSCGLTYTFAVQNARAAGQRECEALRQQVDALQRQLSALPSDGISRSGSFAQPQEGLTPAQVYAKNVGSVVAVSCDTDLTVGGQSIRSTVTGSGFILTEDGYVVTNYHVVEQASAITVTTQVEDEYTATLVGHDSTADMALLKIEAQGLPAVTLGSSSQLIIGDMVVAIGNPLGTLSATQTVGYISGINREVNTDRNVTNMLQTDAAINSGNSGGPLFNMRGEVVGIITAKYSGSSASGASIEGIGFAIPIDDLKRGLEDLQTQGYIRSAYLGITGMDVSREAITVYGLPGGAYVDSVSKDGPAEQAGVEPKDIIIRLGGEKIDSFTALARALRNFAPGDETALTVYRSGKELELSVTLGEKPREEQQETTQDMPSEGDFEEWFRYFNGEKP